LLRILYRWAGDLKDREKDSFDRLKGDWEAWNESMLPERPRPMRYGNLAVRVADRYGITNPPPPGSTE
jgi:hypothetical protein